ncbi:MAG: tRNA (N(6)-L-threonylcarbamoyladenosine(37)-C(2))-methylthiotransferase MtaB [Clostridia bacterium]|nr:tRNA (N(6)-L-threonylcarbamoyladenosine(37)-C(2))-methylthiotransferase MtaB [Clostridia bacterium]
MKAVVFTLGCKVNDVESGSIIRGLEELGVEVSRALEKADLYIINTCAVTGEAERKSRQTASKALKCNPNGKVIVCGCASEKSPNDFFEKDERIVAVTGAQKKNRVLEIATEFIKNGGRLENSAVGVQVAEGDKIYEEMLPPECMKTRNFLKIQDGCNRFCSYCVIPYLRGRSRSRNLESAAAEILQSTAQETVLTGIDISDYRDEKGRDLADLLLAVKDAETRIRLGSLEVGLITERFLAAAKQVKHFAPQFHLSLQSGSNAVLKSMNRHYTREAYLEKCQMIYAAFENAAITTDIIVGFPTETEADFLDSLKIVEEAGFSQIHAFPYSPRQGTNAYKRYKELPFAVKKERVDRILEAGAKQKTAYLERFIGKTLILAPENCIDGFTEGYSENYIRVYVAGEMEKRRTRVRVEGLFKDGVTAVVADEK